MVQGGDIVPFLADVEALAKMRDMEQIEEASNCLSRRWGHGHDRLYAAMMTSDMSRHVSLSVQPALSEVLDGPYATWNHHVFAHHRYGHLAVSCVFVQDSRHVIDQATEEVMIAMTRYVERHHWGLLVTDVFCNDRHVHLGTLSFVSPRLRTAWKNNVPW